MDKAQKQRPTDQTTICGSFWILRFVNTNRNRTEGWVDCEPSNRATYMKASQNAVFFGCKPLQISLGNAPRKDARTPEKLFCPPNHSDIQSSSPDNHSFTLKGVLIETRVASHFG